MDPDERRSLDEALDALWARFRPEMVERVATLETAAAAFAANSLSASQHEQASMAAHKLAGSLGTFGLTRGTVLAREMEVMYSRDAGPDPALAARLTEIAADLRTIVESRK